MTDLQKLKKLMRNKNRKKEKVDFKYSIFYYYKYLEVC